MDREDELEKLVHFKNWSELDEEERQWVLTLLGSPDAYHALRQVHVALKDSVEPELLPAPHVLPALKARFMQQHQRVTLLHRWLFFRVPAYAVSIIITLVAFIVWQVSRTPPAPHAFTPVITTDTVYVASAPDTIVVTKVVYRSITRVPRQGIISLVKSISPSEENNIVGVSMKEKEELENLLVSGVD